MSEILGLRSDVVYAIILILILIILGVITFHYYAFISSGNNSALSAGIGAGFTLLPYKAKEHMTGEEYLKCVKTKGYIKCLNLPPSPI